MAVRTLRAGENFRRDVRSSVLLEMRIILSILITVFRDYSFCFWRYRSEVP